MKRIQLLVGLGIAGTLLGVPELAWSQPASVEVVARGLEESSVEGRLDENSATLNDNSYYNLHRFEGEAGEQITIELTSSEFDAYFLVFDPEGQKIAEDDDGGNETNARTILTLPVSGTYTIIANTYESGESGRYRLSWRAASPEDPELAEAERLHDRAVQLLNEGKYSEAIPLVEQLLAIRRRLLGEEHPSVATSLNNLALLYRSQRRYAEAEPLYIQALEMRQRLLGDEHHYVATSLNNLALLYERQGRYTEAEPLFRQALEMTQRLLGDEHPDVATSLNNLAGLYESQGRYAEAEPLFRQALEMRQRLLGDEHPDVALGLNNLAFVYQRQGRYAEAEPLYIQVLEMAQRLFGDEHLNTATSLNALARLYENQGRYTEAESLFHQALEMRQRLLGKEHLSVATSLNELAGLYHRQGRYAEAEPLFRQALEMTQRLLGEEHLAVAIILGDLAGLYQSQGRYAEAEPLFRQALEMMQRLLGDKHPDVATSLNNLARLYQRQGRYAEAEPLFRQALEMRQRLLGDEHPDLAGSQGNLARLYLSQGRYTEAEPLFRQALEMRQRLLGDEHPYVATNLNNLALLYESQGRYTEAEPLFHQALEMMQRLLGDEHPYVATSLNELARLYQRQGRYAEAEPLFHQALEMMQRLLGDEHPDLAGSLNDLARLYWGQGNLTMALDFQTQGLAVQERNLTLNLATGFDRQKRDFIKQVSGTTDRTLSLHLNSAADNPQAARLALTTVLQRKGRILDVFTNSLQTLRQQIDDPESQELLARLADTYSQLANLTFNRPESIDIEQYRTLIASVEAQAKELEDQLSRRSAQFQILAESVTLDKVQTQIPTGMALVEIVRYRPVNPQSGDFGESRYAAYILHSQGDPQGIDLGETATIDRLVEDFRFGLQDPETSTSQVKQSARDLDAVVMQPIRQRLGNTRKLLLSPDSALNLIPFEALVDKDNRYLLETYDITYLTSGRDLLRLDASTPSKQAPLLLADPFFNIPGEAIALDNTTRTLDLSKLNWSPLPNTQIEVEAIASRLGVTPLMGTQATEEALKQVKSPSILHIATHGFFSDESPIELENITLDDNPLLRSGLVLAGFKVGQSGADDGILTALEATTLNLSGTQLVVLSACDTGIGNIAAGEGIYGLRRSLVIAGAQSQLISLWKVDDEATKDLMVAYYDRLLSGSGRSDALHQTQLEMLQGDEYSHPYYWAAFIPSGNWKAMEK
ncbi:MAG: tetratricopeptide repeat protein [Cyanobacteriota bacterium]|nr:tetratricopeptide repeat protein [Cyanobacteriota bacterium]